MIDQTLVANISLCMCCEAFKVQKIFPFVVALIMTTSNGYPPVLQLRDVYKLPNLPSDDQFFCPHCINIVAHSIRFHKKHSWARTLYCPQCKGTWHICTECKTDQAFKDAKAVANHKYRTPRHKITSELSDDTNFDIGGGDGQMLDDDDDYVQSISNEVSSAPPFQSTSFCQQFPSGSFGRVQTQDYFEHNAHYGHTTSQGGFDWIIAKSQTGLGSPPLTAIRPIDRLLYDDLIHLCTKLSRNDRNVLGRLLGSFKHQIRLNDQMVSDGCMDWFCECPNSPEKIRSQIVDGKYSIFDNLPHPTIIKFGNNTAGVSIIECIQDLLAFGFPTAKITNPSIVGHVNCSEQSSRAQLISKFVQAKLSPFVADMILLFLEWQDDFDPLVTKSNKGSATVKTITIFCPSRSKYRNSAIYTFPVCLAPGKKGLLEYEKFFTKELKALCTPPGITMYSKHHGRMINVAGCLFVSLQDQIAKRPSCGLMAGNSKYHARFGHTFNYGDNQDMASWELPEENQLNFEKLKEITTNVFQQLMKGEISKADAKGQMSKYCLSEDTQLSLLDHYESCLYVKENPLIDHQLYSKVIRKVGPMGDVPWPYPVVWDRPHFDLRHFLDAIMHLLFLGLTKLVMSIGKVWLSKNLKHTAFEQFSKGIHLPIEALHLSWIKPCEYTNSGGKVLCNNLFPLYFLMVDV